MPDIFFLVSLFSRNLNLRCVDNHNVVTNELAGLVVRFVFAHEQGRNMRAQAPEDFVFCINNYPIMCKFRTLGKVRSLPFERVHRAKNGTRDTASMNSPWLR